MTAKSLRHKYVNPTPDAGDPNVTGPDEWNAEHDLFLGKRTVTGTTDTLLDADHLALVQYNSASAVAAAIPQAGASSQFLSGWVTFIRNRGAGAVTFTPTTSTINEVATLVLQQNEYAAIFSDGSNFAAIVTRTAYLPLTGGTLTGDLAISKSQPTLNLTKAASGERSAILGNNGANARWQINLGDGAPETGSNVGSNFTISSYNDAGAFLTSPLTITRSTGLTTIAGDPTTGLGIATKQYVDNNKIGTCTVTRYTSGSGTHTPNAATKLMRVRLFGGGGGGGGTGGTAGGNTTFGALTASGGAVGGVGSAGGVGGAASGGNVLNVVGTPGLPIISVGSTGNTIGGSGGPNPWGGSGGAGGFYGAGSAGQANSGAGGGGGGITGSVNAGSGGGSGGCVEHIYAPPSGSYSWAVGAKGTGGTVSGGGVSGDGGSGLIVVEEYS